MSDTHGNLNYLLSDSDGEEIQFCMDDFDVTNSTLENDNETVPNYETDVAMNDTSEDATNANLNEEMVKQLFTGEAIEVLANGIVENFIDHNGVAPSYDDFSNMYQQKTEEHKLKLFNNIIFNTDEDFNFKEYCNQKRKEYKLQFQQENRDQSFGAYRRKCSARKHRILKELYIAQLISYINLNK